MKIKNKYINLKIENGFINCFIDFYLKKDKKNKIHKSIFKLNYVNQKEKERIWGKDSCNSKYHFYLKIPYLITLDTAYKGKLSLFKSRINITNLFNKDLYIYSSGDGVSSC